MILADHSRQPETWAGGGRALATRVDLVDGMRQV